MSKSNPPDELNFEDAMARLEEIVSQMDGEQLPLDDMVRSYEEGVRLLKVCRGKIDGARARVDRINASLDGSDSAELKPFDPEEEEAPPASAKPRRASSKPKPEEGDSEDDEIRLF